MVPEGLTTSVGYRPGKVSSELDLAGPLAVPASGSDAVQDVGQDVVQTDPRPAPPAPQSERKPRRRHLVLDVSIIAGVVVIYLLSLIGYHYLATAPAPLPAPELGTADGTVVLVRLEQLHPVEHRLDVKVLVMPDDSTVDKRLNVLTTDTSVRLFPHNDLGDLQYPVGKSPAQVATNIEAHGEPGDWPFDTYKTDTIQADVLLGVGDNRQYKPARVEVTGLLEGWDLSVTRVGRDAEDTERDEYQSWQLQRVDERLTGVRLGCAGVIHRIAICTLHRVSLP